MLDVEITRELSEADKQSLWGWGEDIFGTARLGLQWRPKETHIVAREGDRAVSKVSLLRHQVEVGELPLVVGGIGGVVTARDAQGRGLASSLMSRAILYIRDELDAEFGFLFCLDDRVGFYEALGWKRVVAPVRVRQGDGEIMMPINAMTFSISGRAWPGGEVALLTEPW